MILPATAILFGGQVLPFLLLAVIAWLPPLAAFLALLAAVASYYRGLPRRNDFANLGSEPSCTRLEF